MTKPVRVPDPVYERIERQADRNDMPHGEVVREWMNRADEYADLEATQHR